MKTKLLTICLLLFTSQVFADVVSNNVSKLKSLNSCQSCNLEGAKLIDVDLTGAKLINVNFRGAILSGIYLNKANIDLSKPIILF